MTVAFRIFLVMLGIGLVVFLLVGGISWYFLGGLGDYAAGMTQRLGVEAAEQSSQALEQDAELYLLRLVTDQADISNMVFEQIQQEIEVISEKAAFLIIQPESEIPADIYTKDTPPARQGEQGVMHIVPGSAAVLDPEEILLVARLQPVITPLYLADHRLVGMYLVTSSGILLFTPWTSGIDPSFDPRTRDWYTDAVSSENLVWSDPYLDVLGNGMMVTGSNAVREKRLNRTWVIGADVTIETIINKIIGTQIGDRGYAFLLDQDGNVIARPNIANGSGWWDPSVGFENLLQTGNEDLTRISTDMISGYSGVDICHFPDSDRYIAYAPVPSVNWSVGLVVPVDAFTAPARMTRRTIGEASVQTKDLIDNHVILLSHALIGLFFILLIVIFLISLFSSRYISGPVRILKEGAQRIGAGDLLTPVCLNTGDEFEDLAVSFNQMASRLDQYISDLRDTTSREERYKKELEIARNIQESFLPSGSPDIPGFDMVYVSSPALEVGGDFHDFIPLEDGRWGIAIADVSGKGVPAALFMALSRTLLRVSAKTDCNASDIIVRTNDLISEDAKEGMFVTLFFLLLCSDSGRISWVNAGHNPPLVIPAQGAGDTEYLTGNNLALGVMEGMEYSGEERVMKDGDLVVLYTDGITEAMDPDHEEYGTERLCSVLLRHRGGEPGVIMQEILDDIAVFTRGEPQSDDITLILIRYRGPEQ